jgi:hypothetical protein
MKYNVIIIAVSLLVSPLAQAQVTEAQTFTNEYFSFKEKVVNQTSSFINRLFNSGETDRTRNVSNIVYHRKRYESLALENKS